MAVIGAAHGIKGELRVKTFTGDPLALGDYGPLYAKDGRAFEIDDIRPAGDVVVVRFKGIRDRTVAEGLTGTELFVDRSALPEEDEDEYYHADLVGLAVRDETGIDAGKVTAVQNFGGGDILEITFHGREGVLIPFSQAAVPEVDIAPASSASTRSPPGLSKMPTKTASPTSPAASTRSDIRAARRTPGAIARDS